MKASKSKAIEKNCRFISVCFLLLQNYRKYCKCRAQNSLKVVFFLPLQPILCSLIMQYYCKSLIINNLRGGVNSLCSTERNDRKVDSVASFIYTQRHPRQAEVACLGFFYPPHGEVRSNQGGQGDLINPSWPIF